MNIAIVAIAKNEELYIQEWLDYYRKLGFEISGTHFYRFLGKTYGTYAMSCSLK